MDHVVLNIQLSVTEKKLLIDYIIAMTKCTYFTCMLVQWQQIGATTLWQIRNSLKKMKIDLLFLIIAHMLSLHMYQTFILAYSHYMIHSYMNISIVEEIQPKEC